MNDIKEVIEDIRLLARLDHEQQDEQLIPSWSQILAVCDHAEQLERDLAESRAENNKLTNDSALVVLQRTELDRRKAMIEQITVELAESRAQHYALAEKNTELEQRKASLISEVDRLDAIRRQQEQDNSDLSAKLLALHVGLTQENRQLERENLELIARVEALEKLRRTSQPATDTSRV